MKTSYMLALAALLAACNKDHSTTPIPGKPYPDQPEMLYTDLKDVTIKQGQSFYIDLNKDGDKDVSFGTWYIGNPNQHEDEVLFYAQSYISSMLLMDTTNESSPRYTKGASIGINIMPSHHQWYELSMTEIARKNIPATYPIYWEGLWKQARHLYLGVQVQKGYEWYAGWVELSFDTATEKLTLHRAAISKTPRVSVYAGI